MKALKLHQKQKSQLTQKTRLSKGKCIYCDPSTLMNGNKNIGSDKKFMIQFLLRCNCGHQFCMICLNKIISTIKLNSVLDLYMKTTKWYCDIEQFVLDKIPIPGFVGSCCTLKDSIHKIIEEPLVVRSELGGSLHVAGVNLILMPAFKHSIVVHAFGNDASSGIIGLLHGVVPNNLVIDTLPDGSASFLIHERCQTLIVKDICNNSRKIKVKIELYRTNTNCSQVPCDIPTVNDLKHSKIVNDNPPDGFDFKIILATSNVDRILHLVCIRYKGISSVCNPSKNSRDGVKMFHDSLKKCRHGGHEVFRNNTGGPIANSQAMQSFLNQRGSFPRARKGVVILPSKD